jgi:dihydrolipoamide dehydrogenase
MRNVDTVTVGAGGGAYPAAFALARAGQKVVMIDTKGVMSGNCLAEGCVPSKAVREVAELHRRTGSSERFGLDGNQNVDYARIIAHKDKVQRTRYAQHDAELAELAGRLELVGGKARLVDPHTVEVETSSGTERLQGSHLIVASGADVFIPPIPGAELCVTSRDLFALGPAVDRLPARLAVIGGGYIGLEVACMLNALGTRVTVIEATGQLLPGMDKDFVSLVAAGIDPSIEIRLDSTVRSVTKAKGGLQVGYDHGGASEAVDADMVLMAVGRHPVIPEGAAEVGLAMEGRAIGVDATIRTNLSHVYAPGDVNGRSMLFHSAVRQSLVAAHNILAGDGGVDRMDFASVPTTIFTSPEASYVGITRARARSRAGGVIEGSYAFEGDSRAQILDETYGELRLFFDPESLRLLGGWVVGIDAAQLIGEIGLAVSAGLTAYDLARFADQHPMAAEGISRAARSVAG